MFTLASIQAAHAKVQSGADFPAYFRELIALGVASYDCDVADGHIIYFDAGGATIAAAARYPVMEVADFVNMSQFNADLKAHQQGQTDYLTFCKDCATSGVAKWRLDMQAFTCTYFDAAGKALLTEAIPV